MRDKKNCLNQFFFKFLISVVLSTKQRYLSLSTCGQYPVDNPEVDRVRLEFAQSFCATFSAGRVFHFIAGAWDFFTSWFCTDYSAKTGGNCELGTSQPEKVRHGDKLTSYLTTFQCRNELSSPLKRLSVIYAVVQVYRNSVHNDVQ